MVRGRTRRVPRAPVARRGLVRLRLRSLPTLLAGPWRASSLAKLGTRAPSRGRGCAALCETPVLPAVARCALDASMTVDETRIRPPAPGATPDGAARLVFVEGAALLGVSVPLDAEVVLGREPGCALRLPADDVSRRHARIAPAGDGHLVEDLGSTNGTFVNGEAVSARRLASGDRIRVGSFVARYVAAGDAAGRELEALAALARRDPLTGLANRRALEEALAREVGRAARDGAPLAVVALDVDHFKRVNDGTRPRGRRRGPRRGSGESRRGAPRGRPPRPDRRRGVRGAAARARTLAAAAEVAERVRAAVAGAPVAAGAARLARHGVARRRRARAGARTGPRSSRVPTRGSTRRNGRGATGWS